MSRKKTNQRKLSSQRGETIAEVLVALLVSAMGMMMLAGMVFASGKMITKSRASMSEYIGKENTLSARSGVGTAGTVSFTVNGDETRLTDGSGSDLSVTYSRETLGNRTIISYRGE